MMAYLTGLAFLIFHTVASLYVLPDSPCARTCVAGESTASGNLVCSDDQYFGSSVGTTFRQCLICELQSLSYNGTISDQYWSIFHMKFTQNFCLFELSPPTDSINACRTDCVDLRDMLSVNPIGTLPWKEQYDYCADDSNSYSKNGPRCAQCLQAHTGSVVLGNFMQEMISLCDLRPYASKAASITTTQDLFQTSTTPIASTTPITISSPTISGSILVSRPPTSSTMNPTQTSDAAPSSSWKVHLSTGATAGIGVAGALTGVALIGLIVWIVMRKRRNTLEERSSDKQVWDQKGNSDTYPTELGNEDCKEIGEQDKRPELGEGKVRQELETAGTGWVEKPAPKVLPVEMQG